MGISSCCLISSFCSFECFKNTPHHLQSHSSHLCGYGIFEFIYCVWPTREYPILQIPQKKKIQRRQVGGGGTQTVGHLKLMILSSKTTPPQLYCLPSHSGEAKSFWNHSWHYLGCRRHIDWYIQWFKQLYCTPKYCGNDMWVLEGTRFGIKSAVWDALRSGHSAPLTCLLWNIFFGDIWRIVYFLLYHTQ